MSMIDYLCRSIYDVRSSSSNSLMESIYGPERDHVDVVVVLSATNPKIVLH
jgi:hypothetical protein